MEPMYVFLEKKEFVSKHKLLHEILVGRLGKAFKIFLKPLGF